jgi:hypothetical protein
VRDRIPWPFVCAALAVAVQTATALAVRALYDGAFGAPPSVGEDGAVRATYALLLAGSLASGALGVAGTYAAVLRLGRASASLLVLCVYAPIVFVAVTALYGALVLLAII